MNLLAPGFLILDDRPQLELDFAADGSGRTWLARRHVRFPFSLGDAYSLDDTRPDIATVILQSASGGLYRGERLATRLRAGPDARARLVTSAATAVYSARGGQSVSQSVELCVEDGASLAYLPRSLVLFPGARLSTATKLTCAAGHALLRDGFAMHSPARAAGTFDLLEARLTILGPGGRPLLLERSRTTGHEIELGHPGVAGAFRAFGSAVLVAPADPDLVAAAAVATLPLLDTLPRCYAGLTRLRGDTGLLVRLAAQDGGALEAALDRLIEHLETKFFL